MKRCRWCGRFVASRTEPLVGLDWLGRPIAQVLCPADANEWRDLAARNVYRGGVR